METPTPEQTQQHITNAFDSVNLINTEIEKEMTPDQERKVKINYQHLELMLSKDWFAAGCTTQQITDINAAITAGKAYIA